jgi:hypothetical protein
MKDYSHYSTILAASGILSGIMTVSLLSKVMPKKVKDAKKPPEEPKPKPKLAAGWIYPIAGTIVGTFALMAAWGLFPNITTLHGWITFILLIWIALTFLLRAISALNFHVWLPTGIAVWAATNMMNWVGQPFSLFGFTIIPDWGTVLFLTAVLTIGAWIILTVLLLWLSHTATFTNKVLNTAPLLFINTLLCLVWAVMLVIFQWSL